MSEVPLRTGVIIWRLKTTSEGTWYAQIFSASVPEAIWRENVIALVPNSISSFIDGIIFI
jgi:hypothetical protein